ncbi:uncharacterized protein BDR25DRAFT_392059 [Lindgomyces ingoldianus]|uniref:Uncharacterized protein n=1 Tax=Lindgomyces ingoldianus TaxID=673940 RepID=A0ACB6R6E0_9PLEO|nr:uncharacterized protein BDR25DRAFT_392059 [Lindgomyces ingoldianus]KAF2474340.1 hypothetical protein BDR25DRAFT_392059 [Lindgomyces ingoldianus]
MVLMAGVTEVPDSEDEFMTSSPVVTSISADRLSPAKDDALHAKDAFEAFGDDVSSIALKQVESLNQAQANIFANIDISSPTHSADLQSNEPPLQRREANPGNIETVQELECMQVEYSVTERIEILDPAVRNSEQKMSERVANAEVMEFVHPISQPGDNDGGTADSCVVSVDRPILTVQKSESTAEDESAKRQTISPDNEDTASMLKDLPSLEDKRTVSQQEIRPLRHSHLPVDATKLTGGELSFRPPHQESDRGMKEEVEAAIEKIHSSDERSLKDVEMADAGHEGRRTPQPQIDPSKDPSRRDETNLTELTIPALNASSQEHSLCGDGNRGTKPTTKATTAQDSQQRGSTSDISTRESDSAAKLRSLLEPNGSQTQNSPPNTTNLPEPQPQPESSPPVKPGSPLKSSSPSKSSQDLEELRAHRGTLIASLAALPNIQDAIAKTNASSTASSPSTAELTDAEVMAAANKIVKKHIKLLHEYNEIKDVGQGLMGLIADQRGVRIVEIQDEFGICAKD